MPVKQKLICVNGHTYYKSSNCRVCPICERSKQSDEGFLSLFAAPARWALVQHGVKSISDLSSYSLAEVTSWHGIGLTAIKIIKQQLSVINKE